MKLIIDIPEEDYNNGTLVNYFNCYSKQLDEIIYNGTLLPKGHGRLIDADAYRKELRKEIPNLDYDGSLEPYAEGIYSAIMSLDDEPIVLEADKGE